MWLGCVSSDRRTRDRRRCANGRRCNQASTRMVVMVMQRVVAMVVVLVVVVGGTLRSGMMHRRTYDIAPRQVAGCKAFLADRAMHRRALQHAACFVRKLRERDGAVLYGSLSYSLYVTELRC